MECELGDLLMRKDDRVAVTGQRIYPAVGVAKNGAGLFVKESFVGGQTKYTSLTPVAAGEVVLRTITAFEAPAAVASDEHDGHYVSPSVFPVFRVVSAEVLPRYLALYFQTTKFQHEMQSRSRGTVLRRTTITPREFLQIPIDLPGRQEQRRIVDLLAAADDALAAQAALVEARRTAREALLSSLLAAHPHTRKLSDVADVQLGKTINPREADLSPGLARTRWRLFW